MVAADAGTQDPGVRHRASNPKAFGIPIKNPENDAAVALPFKLQRHVQRVGESAKHRVIEKWTRLRAEGVRAKGGWAHRDA
eukprot:524189-Prorocentrum_minimum.AAC.1